MSEKRTFLGRPGHLCQRVLVSLEKDAWIGKKTLLLFIFLQKKNIEEIVVIN